MKSVHRFFLIFSLVLPGSVSPGFSQSNMHSTNPEATAVMLGNYDPFLYMPSAVLNHPSQIITGIENVINADSLHRYLIALASFTNRNTGSDTVSEVKGIGAARRWVYQKFTEIGAENENRLIPSYLQFDQSICGMLQHRSPFAVLPGLDTSDPSIIIIESHLDSRCEENCDTACVAEGVDDNGSGTALVIELARVLSRYSFSHTLVFLANTGEEQGLYGAEAFADFVDEAGIKVKAVQNNDIVGGILCGETSSPPGCPGFGLIDSTQVRLFSHGGFNSPSKGYARFIKLQYNENLKGNAAVPMLLSIMTAEDRTGRSGDHVPFRQHGFIAMRFSSANENGDAGVSDPGYSDNQHTSRDVLGYDTDFDGQIDSFLVDMNYLKRNAQINANAAAMAAIGPQTPEFDFSVAGNNLHITISSSISYDTYRLGLRKSSYDFDSVYTFSGMETDITLDTTGICYVSVASVDSNGIESLFGNEEIIIPTGIFSGDNASGFVLLPVKPNPADESTMISFYAAEIMAGKEATVAILDLQGKKLKETSMTIREGLNEWMYHHGHGASGTFLIQLLAEDRILTSRLVIR